MKLTEHDDKYGGMGFTRKIGAGVYNSRLLSSGIFALDLAHGIGGIRTGSVIRLMGAPGLGKSSIAYRIVASGLKAGMSALIIDSEGGFNEPILMDTLEDAGLDPEDPNLSFRYATATNLRDVKWTQGHPDQKSKQPVMTLERIVPMVEDWVVSEDISPNGAIVVFDSLDLLIPEPTVGSKIDDVTVALVARRMKSWMRQFIGTIRGTGSMLVIVHQVSSKIDVRSYDPETFSGGNALRHASHFDLRLKDIGQETVGEEVVGRKVKGMITKSKQGLPWRTFEYVIRYDTGPDNIGAVFEAAKKLGVITGTTWLVLPPIDDFAEPIKIQGKEAVREYLIANPVYFSTLRNLTLEAARGHIDELAPTVPEELQAEYGE